MTGQFKSDGAVEREGIDAAAHDHDRWLKADLCEVQATVNAIIADMSEVEVHEAWVRLCRQGLIRPGSDDQGS